MLLWEKEEFPLRGAHTNYNPPKLSEYMEQANKKTVLLAQIETEEAVENVEKIAAVAGIDVLVVGPSDLSSDLGDPGNLKSEKLLAAAEKVAEAARKYGKQSGTVSANLQYLRACQKMGMTVFNNGKRTWNASEWCKTTGKELLGRGDR